MPYLGSTALAEEDAPVAVESEQHVNTERFLTTAELAECTCPDFCERDHDTD